MKFTFPKLPLAGTLLVSYAVYSAFVPVSIPHSIILFSLATLFGVEKFLHIQQLPSMDKKLESLKLELQQQLKLQKEEHEAKILELKQEQSRQTIERANSVSVSPKKPTIQF